MATSSTEDPNASLIYGSLYAISVCGILGALLTLLLSVAGPKIKGDYKYFICNVAIINLITEVVWLGYLLSVRVYSAANLPLPLLYALSILIFSSYLTALTAPLPATFSRFIIFRKPMGLLQYKHLFTKKRMIFYFVICDCYPYFLGYMSAMSKSFTVQILFATIFMVSFVLCYFLVGGLSLNLYRVMRRYAAQQQALNVADYYEKKQVAMAFLYLGVVPLCCQFFHLVYAILYIYALYWPASLTGPFWAFFKAFLTFIIMYGIAINPIIDTIIVFVVIKPYKIALYKAIDKLCLKMKVHPSPHQVIDVAILHADRYWNRRSTVRTSLGTVRD